MTILMDDPAAVAMTLIGLFFYGMTIYRGTVWRERNRAEKRASRFELAWRSHKCPEPIVVTVEVERNHDPYKRQPWMEVG